MERFVTTKKKSQAATLTFAMETPRYTFTQWPSPPTKRPLAAKRGPRVHWGRYDNRTGRSCGMTRWKVNNTAGGASSVGILWTIQLGVLRVWESYEQYSWVESEQYSWGCFECGYPSSVGILWTIQLGVLRVWVSYEQYSWGCFECGNPMNNTAGWKVNNTAGGASSVGILRVWESYEQYSWGCFECGNPMKQRMLATLLIRQQQQQRICLPCCRAPFHRKNVVQGVVPTLFDIHETLE